jgi:hypothetical protein
MQPDIYAPLRSVEEREYDVQEICVRQKRCCFIVELEAFDYNRQERLEFHIAVPKGDDCRALVCIARRAALSWLFTNRARRDYSSWNRPIQLDCTGWK